MPFSSSFRCPSFLFIILQSLIHCKFRLLAAQNNVKRYAAKAHTRDLLKLYLLCAKKTKREWRNSPIYSIAIFYVLCLFGYLCIYILLFDVKLSQFAISRKTIFAWTSLASNFIWARSSFRKVFIWSLNFCLEKNTSK